GEVVHARRTAPIYSREAEARTAGGARGAENSTTTSRSPRSPQGRKARSRSVAVRSRNTPEGSTLATPTSPRRGRQKPSPPRAAATPRRSAGKASTKFARQASGEQRA